MACARRGSGTTAAVFVVHPFCVRPPPPTLQWLWPSARARGHHAAAAGMTGRRPSAVTVTRQSAAAGASVVGPVAATPAPELAATRPLAVATPGSAPFPLCCARLKVSPTTADRPRSRRAAWATPRPHRRRAALPSRSPHHCHWPIPQSLHVPEGWLGVAAGQGMGSRGRPAEEHEDPPRRETRREKRRLSLSCGGRDVHWCAVAATSVQFSPPCDDCGPKRSPLQSAVARTATHTPLPITSHRPSVAASTLANPQQLTSDRRGGGRGWLARAQWQWGRGVGRSRARRAALASLRVRDEGVGGATPAAGHRLPGRGRARSGDPTLALAVRRSAYEWRARAEAGARPVALGSCCLLYPK